MNCPVCDERLREINRHGIDIDICPACKGVWLDRGELDKIIELVSGGTNERCDSRESSREIRHTSETHRDNDRDSHYDKDQYDKDSYNHKKPRKREGLLGEIFDIFG